MTSGLVSVPIGRRYRERDLILVAYVFAGALVVQFGRSTSPQLAAWIGLAACAASLIVVTWTQPKGFWSAPALCLAVMCAFHFGALPEYLLAGEVFTDTVYAWMTPPQGPDALWISTLGVLMFTAAVVAVAPARRVSPLPGLSPFRNRDMRTDRQQEVGGLPVVALVALVASVTAWFTMTMVAGGLNPVSSTYLDYLDAGKSIPFAGLYQSIGLGFALLALGKPGRQYRLGLAVFAVFAVVAFAVGFRGEVLFPILTHVALLAYRRRLPSVASILAIGIVGLSLISLVQDVRLAGVENYEFTPSSVSPLGGITELGFSQHVVERTYDWHHHGEPFAWGASYWAPVERVLLRAVGADRVPGDDDDRLYNVLVSDREPGSIGGSVIGEAYHNGGRLGVVLVLSLWGALVGGLAARARSGLTLAILGIVVFAFFWHVRNSFTPIPLQVAGALIVVLATIVAWPPGSGRARRSHGVGIR